MLEHGYCPECKQPVNVDGICVNGHNVIVPIPTWMMVYQKLLKHERLDAAEQDWLAKWMTEMRHLVSVVERKLETMRGVLNGTAD